jgi:hypothetical protein
MKKKGPRSVPDFSRKQKGRPDPAAANVNAPPRPSTPVVVKPKTTSSKAGRRGG